MPGNGPHHWYFPGKTPWIAWVLYSLLFANTITGLVAFPIYGHFAHVSPATRDWLDTRFIEIQFVLLGLIALVFVIYRKNVRYEYRGAKRK